MREIERNIIFGKAGGNASKNSYSCKVSLPADAIEALGATPEDRSVIMKITEDGRIIIEKA